MLALRNYLMFAVVTMIGKQNKFMKRIMRTITTFCMLLGFCLSYGQSYSFTTITDQYQNFKKSGESQKLRYVVSDQKFATEMYMTGIRIIANIVNLEDSTITMVTYAGASKSGMQHKIPAKTEQVPTDSIVNMQASPSMDFFKTDEVKEMDGYKCSKYVCDGPTTLTEVWLLEGHADLDFFGLQTKMMSAMPPMSSGGENGPTSANGPAMEKGFPMEIYTEMKNDKQTSTLMRVTELKIADVDTSVFDMSDVKMIESKLKEKAK